MTFLSPLAGLIAGAVAIPLLALFYFLKLRRRPVRISSTLLWERSVQDLQANAPFRWIRPSLLLFLQLLALALLLLAFARPAIDAGAAAPGKLVILIDASASMSAPHEPGGARTRLDEAKRLASETVDRLSRSFTPGAPSRTSAMIIEFAAAARAVTNFTSDRAVLAAAIRAIEPTDQPADFEGALRLVEAQVLRAGEEDDGARPRVALFSDGALQRSSAASAAARAGVGAADFSFVRVGPDPGAPLDNLGVVALSARRDYSDPALIRVFLRIQNAGPADVEVPVRLQFRGEPAGARTVRVPGAAPPSQTSPNGAPVPGEVATTFELRFIDSGPLLVSLARRDELPSDNDAGLVLLSPRPPRALLVRPALRTAGESIAEASLQRALEEITARDVPIVDAAAYERLVSSRAGLADYDLVVFDRVRPNASPPLPSISFGAALPIPGLALEDLPSGGAGAPAGASRILSWRRTHPLLRDVGLDPVVLARPPSLALPSADAPRARASIEPIAFGAAGPLIASIDDGAVRRVVVSFPLAQSTWTLQPSFVIFLANAVEHLTPLGQAASGRAFSTAEPATVRALPAADRLRVRGPVSFDVPLSAAGAEAAGVVSLGALPRVGLYTVEGAVADDAIIAANLVDPLESAIATTDSVDVAGRRMAGTGLGDTAPREVWHWFVLGALAVSTVEWLLFAWRTRV